MNAPNKPASLPLAEIKIGCRHRRDMGDIGSLAASISELGLLHPVVVTPDRTLIAGQRRLEAYRVLGRTEIEVTVLDLERVVRGEYAENMLRKAFAPSEIADIADALEPIEREAAKARQQEHGHTAPGHKHSGEIPHSVRRALDRVAKVVGKDRKTLTKIRAVRDAAKENPERFGKLAADMDRTGRVDGPYRRLQVARQAEVLRGEPPPYPSNGPYRVIVADPPWPYEVDKFDPADRATHPYPQMSLVAICDEASKVNAIAHPDCILWLWTTNHHLRKAYDVLDAWGFTGRNILTWVKDRFGQGHWLRSQTEHCLMAVRGEPVVELTNQSTVLLAPVAKHSAKPDEFYTLVESLCPAPRYAELFQRKARERWDGHGDEMRQQHAADQGGAA